VVEVELGMQTKGSYETEERTKFAFILLPWPLSGPKTNLAEAHQDKTPATQLKGTTNVVALRTKIQTFSRKQDFNIQMHIKADLDVWNSTMVCAKPSNTKIIQRP
jgi:hypothetical protein